MKEKLRMKIAISQIKNEEEKAMNKKEKFIFKNKHCTPSDYSDGVLI